LLEAALANALTEEEEEEEEEERVEEGGSITLIISPLSAIKKD